MIELPEEFCKLAKERLKDEYGDFIASYNRAPYKAVRVNTLKIERQKFIDIMPFSLTPVEWEKNGFYVSEEKVGKTVLHAAGLYYVQEPSAMSAAPLLNVRPGERALDMCSAPGGKGTQLAQNMQGEGVIVLNEIDYSRAKILLRNVERLGVKNALVTCASSKKIAENFPGYFDKVLIDAPCSGEGMFLKEPNAVKEWSVKNVELCAKRQADILQNAAKTLRPGGLMVYSTCTFAAEEDELQIENFLAKHSEFSVVSMQKLLPHKIKGEGHFVCLMKKSGEGAEYIAHKNIKLHAPTAKQTELFKSFRNKVIRCDFRNLHTVGETLYALPDNCPDTSDIQLLRAGVCLGEFKGDRFEPSHSLAMCLRSGEAECVEVDEGTALNYLLGRIFSCNEKLSGWLAVSYLGYNLGWCKCSQGIAKNHLPKGLRINV